MLISRSVKVLYVLDIWMGGYRFKHIEATDALLVNSRNNVVNSLQYKYNI